MAGTIAALNLLHFLLHFLWLCCTIVSVALVSSVVALSSAAALVPVVVAH